MKKIIIIFMSLFMALSCFGCLEKTEEPTYNTECDYVFYIGYIQATNDFYFMADIINKTDKSIVEIRDLKIEIDFGDDITTKFLAKDIEFNIPLKPNETTNKIISTYSLNVGLGSNDIDKKKENMSKDTMQSISYKNQTYKIYYALI